MACMKQTARKNTGGKPVAMGRGKNPAPKPKPKPGRADRKVIIEYSSDEFDEENPQTVEGTGAQKRVIRQIHLTLPTSPTHVTTTESFKTFFINHGLTKALRKAFENRGWSTNQMQELMTNFKNKYGQTIPLPNIYQDEDSSDDKGLVLGDGTRYRKVVVEAKAVEAKAVEAEVVDARVAMGVWTPRQDLRRAVVVMMVVVLVEQAVALVEDSWASEVEMTTMMMMTLTSAGRWGMKADHRGRPWLVKSHADQAQLTPQLTETCQFSISLVERRELGWAIAYWIGLQCRRE